MLFSGIFPKIKTPVFYGRLFSATYILYYHIFLWFIQEQKIPEFSGIFMDLGIKTSSRRQIRGAGCAGRHRHGHGRDGRNHRDAALHDVPGNDGRTLRHAAER